MKKWWVIILVVGLIAGGWVAGPILTVKAIRTAIREQDAAELAKHVDFPALRSSFKLQIDDYLARKAGAEAQSSLLGSLTLTVASAASGGLVDMLATPAGVAAIMQGNGVWRRIGALGRRDRGDHGDAAPTAADPLAGAHYGFQSLSRFTATVNNANGKPVVFVLTREGLQWKVTDIELPLPATPDDDSRQ